MDESIPEFLGINDVKQVICMLRVKAVLFPHKYFL